MDAVMCRGTVGHVKGTWGGAGGRRRTYTTQVWVREHSDYMGEIGETRRGNQGYSWVWMGVGGCGWVY